MIEDTEYGWPTRYTTHIPEQIYGVSYIFAYGVLVREPDERSCVLIRQLHAMVCVLELLTRSVHWPVTLVNTDIDSCQPNLAIVSHSLNNPLVHYNQNPPYKLIYSDRRKWKGSFHQECAYFYAVLLVAFVRTDMGCTLVVHWNWYGLYIGCTLELTWVVHWLYIGTDMRCTLVVHWNWYGLYIGCTLELTWVVHWNWYGLYMGCTLELIWVVH